jgi:tetratricopeptide (TPR) repeat protein
MRTLGDRQSAASWAERAVRHFRAQSKEATSDPIPSIFALADSLILLGRYREATGVLLDGWRLRGAKSCLLRVPEICSEWLDRPSAEVERGQTGLPLPLEMGVDLVLQNQLAINGNNIGLVRGLIANADDSGKAGQAAQERLEAISKVTEYRASVAFSRGLDAIQRGRLREAREWMQTAYAADPSQPGIVNNLAMLWIEVDPPDYAAALSLVQDLLKQFPKNPEFLDTRALVYLKLGQYENAVRDAEAALLRTSDRKAAHRTLAEAYRHLGDPSLAAEHASLAEGEPGSPSKSPR